MPKALIAVDSATNNKQLLDLKSSNLSLQRMKSYNMVIIMSIVALSLSQAYKFSSYPCISTLLCFVNTD